MVSLPTPLTGVTPPRSLSATASPESSSPAVFRAASSDAFYHDSAARAEGENDVTGAETAECGVDFAGGHHVTGQPQFKQKGDCRVCALPADGLYFGSLVCLPCKTFFIRYSNDHGISCRQGDGRCDIRGERRTSCKYCRFQRCLQVGMVRRERPLKVDISEGEKLCMVCEDIATGIHFGVVSCEGCKKFYRRGRLEFEKYQCRKDTRCEVNPRSRNACRACRFQKCVRVGMSPEAVKMGRPRKWETGEGGFRPTSKAAKRKLAERARQEAAAERQPSLELEEIDTVSIDSGLDGMWSGAAPSPAKESRFKFPDVARNGATSSALPPPQPQQQQPRDADGRNGTRAPPSTSDMLDVARNVMVQAVATAQHPNVLLQRQFAVLAEQSRFPPAAAVPNPVMPPPPPVTTHVSPQAHPAPSSLPPPLLYAYVCRNGAPPSSPYLYPAESSSSGVPPPSAQHQPGSQPVFPNMIAPPPQSTHHSQTAAAAASFPSFNAMLSPAANHYGGAFAASSAAVARQQSHNNLQQQQQFINAAISAASQQHQQLILDEKNHSKTWPWNGVSNGDATASALPLLRNSDRLPGFLQQHETRLNGETASVSSRSSTSSVASSREPGRDLPLVAKATESDLGMANAVELVKLVSNHSADVNGTSQMRSQQMAGNTDTNSSSSDSLEWAMCNLPATPCLAPAWEGLNYNQDHQLKKARVYNGHLKQKRSGGGGSSCSSRTSADFDQKSDDLGSESHCDVTSPRKSTPSRRFSSQQHPAGDMAPNIEGKTELECPELDMLERDTEARDFQKILHKVMNTYEDMKILPQRDKRAHMLKGMVYPVQYWLQPDLPSPDQLFSEDYRSLINEIMNSHETYINICDEVSTEEQNMLREAKENSLTISKEEIRAHRIERLMPAGQAFFNSFPGWLKLEKEDRFLMMRLGGVQMQILNACILWRVPAKREFKNYLQYKFRPGSPYHHFKECVFEFSEQVINTQMDRAELAFMSILLMISTDWRDLKDEAVVASVRQDLLKPFTAYVTAKYGTPNTRIQTLFSYVPRLRELGLMQYRFELST